MIFRRIIFLFCIPFSFIYFFIISMRNILYNIYIFKKYNLNARVISVGNITWGGTGKTPMTAFIADILVRRNHKVSILIRGYGNDESELLPKLVSNVPVLIGKDRVKKGAEAIENYFSDTILLDDGFQYIRLKRDLDIVCVDAVKPFGNGWMIPAGTLRESLNSLKRADIFLITKIDLVSNKDKLEKLEKKLKSINPKAIIAKAIHRPMYFYRLSDIAGNSLPRTEVKPFPTDEEKVHHVRDNLPKASYQGISNGVNIGELQNKELALVSAIGSPECFEKTILRLGLKINKHFIYRDHYKYTEKDITHIENYCKKNKLDTVITTEKDAVKLKDKCRGGFQTRPYSMDGAVPERARYALQLLVLKVRLEIIENENGFYNRLFGIYNS